MSERFKIPLGDSKMRLVAPPRITHNPVPLTLEGKVIGDADVLDIHVDDVGNIWLDTEITFKKGAPVTLVTQGVRSMAVSLSAGIFLAERVNEVAVVPEAGA